MTTEETRTALQMKQHRQRASDPPEAARWLSSVEAEKEMAETSEDILVAFIKAF